MNPRSQGRGGRRRRSSHRDARETATPAWPRATRWAFRACVHNTLQSIVNAGPEGPSGCPRPRRRRGFPRVPVARPPASSPAPLRTRVHPLVSLASSSEYEPHRTCPLHGCSERLPRGPLSPSRHEQRRSTYAEGPTPPLRSVLGVSHALDGFRPPLPRGLVSSPSHVRDSPPRGLFPPPSQAASSTARALLSLTTGSCNELPRCSSSDDLAFRALIRAAIRSHRRGS